MWKMVHIAAIDIPCGMQMKIMCFTLVWYVYFLEIYHLKITEDLLKRSDVNGEFYNCYRNSLTWLLIFSFATISVLNVQKNYIEMF